MINKRFKYFISASLFTISIIALSVLLKSEAPNKIKTEPQISERPDVLNIYEEPITLVTGKGKPKQDYYRNHVSSAQASGVGILDDSTSIMDLVLSQDLIAVKPGKGYEIDEITHSYAYLTPDALRVLRKLGASFYEESNNSFFTVTSLTRTEAMQKKLRKRNRNATKNESSHCYGVSFDISYIRYNGERNWNLELRNKLEGILATMQKNGEIYVLKERNQSCFHITVRTDKKGA